MKERVEKWGKYEKKLISQISKDPPCTYSRTYVENNNKNKDRKANDGYRNDIKGNSNIDNNSTSTRKYSYANADDGHRNDNKRNNNISNILTSTGKYSYVENIPQNVNCWKINNSCAMLIYLFNLIYLHI